jgi:hypothetical protein
MPRRLHGEIFMKGWTTSRTQQGLLKYLQRHISSSALWIVSGGILLTLVFGELPGQERYSAVLQDGCHAPAFATLSLISLTLLARRVRYGERNPVQQTRATDRSVLTHAAATVVTMALLGAATEVLQGLLGGDAEVDDAICDVVGSIAASSFWVYMHLRARADTGARIGRSVAILACAATIGYWIAPMVRCADAYWNRYAQFPVLAQFRSQRDLYFITSSAGEMQIVPVALRASSDNTGGDTPSTALRAVLDHDRWPGITLSEPISDWRRYRMLALDLSNPGESAMSLRLRINDRAHDGEFDDRFNSDVSLPPRGRTTIRIPLEGVASSPRSRRMDMSQIAEVALFRDGSAPGQVVLLHRIWLQ